MWNYRGSRSVYSHDSWWFSSLCIRAMQCREKLRALIRDWRMGWDLEDWLSPVIRPKRGTGTGTFGDLFGFRRDHLLLFATVVIQSLLNFCLNFHLNYWTWTILQKKIRAHRYNNKRKVSFRCYRHLSKDVDWPGFRVMFSMIEIFVPCTASIVIQDNLLWI